MAEKTLEERMAVLEATTQHTSGALAKINELASNLDNAGTLDILATVGSRQHEYDAGMTEIEQRVVDLVKNVEGLEQGSAAKGWVSALENRLGELESGKVVSGGFEGRLEVVEAQVAQVAESLSVLLTGMKEEAAEDLELAPAKKAVVDTLLERLKDLELLYQGFPVTANNTRLELVARLQKLENRLEQLEHDGGLRKRVREHSTRLENMEARVKLNCPACADNTKRLDALEGLGSRDPLGKHENQRVHNELRKRMVREENQRSTDIVRLDELVGTLASDLCNVRDVVMGQAGAADAFKSLDGQLARVRENHDSLSCEVAHAEEDREQLNQRIDKLVRGFGAMARKVERLTSDRWPSMGEVVARDMDKLVVGGEGDEIDLPWKDSEGVYEDDGPPQPTTFTRRGIKMQVSPTQESGINTGRTRFRVVCRTCGEVVHTGTTSATLLCRGHIEKHLAQDSQLLKDSAKVEEKPVQKPQAPGSLANPCPVCGAGIGSPCVFDDGKGHVRLLPEAHESRGYEPKPPPKDLHQQAAATMWPPTPPSACPPPPLGPPLQSFSEVNSVRVTTEAWVREAGAIVSVVDGMDSGLLADDIDELCSRWVRERGIAEDL